MHSVTEMGSVTGSEMEIWMPKAIDSARCLDYAKEKYLGFWKERYLHLGSVKEIWTDSLMDLLKRRAIVKG